MPLCQLEDARWFLVIQERVDRMQTGLAKIVEEFEEFEDLEYSEALLLGEHAASVG